LTEAGANGSHHSDVDGITIEAIEEVLPTDIPRAFSDVVEAVHRQNPKSDRQDVRRKIWSLVANGEVELTLDREIVRH
jgi:hypothetical protein